MPKAKTMRIPLLYRRGISSGDFQEALSALLGKGAPNLSPAVLGRLKASWKEEFARWQQRDLSARRSVYVWADGVYLQARMDVDRFLAKYQVKYDKATDRLAKDREALLAFYGFPAEHSHDRSQYCSQVELTDEIHRA